MYQQTTCNNNRTCVSTLDHLCNFITNTWSKRPAKYHSQHNSTYKPATGFNAHNKFHLYPDASHSLLVAKIAASNSILSWLLRLADTLNRTHNLMTTGQHSQLKSIEPSIKSNLRLVGHQLDSKLSTVPFHFFQLQTKKTVYPLPARATAGYVHMPRVQLNCNYVCLHCSCELVWAVNRKTSVLALTLLERKKMNFITSDTLRSYMA